MNQVDKVVSIQKILDKLYPPPVPVPLNSINDFTFLCAVILSAQTTDGKVNDVTKRLFVIAPTPEKMAELQVSVVQEIIQPVGLAPTKASNLIKMAKRLIAEYNGEIPNNYEDLESLAGVGHKTASVVMSQVFDEPQIAVDTHVHRLALRWGLSKEERNVGKVQTDLCNLFPKENWNKLHLQMIYFGREYCTAKDHKNSDCPICSWVSNSKKEPPEDLSVFIPHKKAKGIVHYEDRKQELEMSPELSTFSPNQNPPPIIMKTITPTMNVMSSPPVATRLDMNEKPILKRKREKNSTSPSEMIGIVTAPITITATIMKRKKKNILSKERI